MNNQIGVIRPTNNANSNVLNMRNNHISNRLNGGGKFIRLS